MTEKLPSFNILYPLPRYRDTRVFGAAYGAGQSIYVYHIQPYRVFYNENLRWQRNRNAEVGIDVRWGELAVSLAGYFNRTKFPYELSSQYDPFTYRISSLPAQGADGGAYKMPANPSFRVARETGSIWIGNADDPSQEWVQAPGEDKRTFVENTMQDNGSAVDRMGLEFVVDFPQINPIRTQLRLDGTYAWTKYINEGEACYYPATTSGGTFYPYAGIYADNGGRASVTYFPSIRGRHMLSMSTRIAILRAAASTTATAIRRSGPWPMSIWRAGAIPLPMPRRPIRRSRRCSCVRPMRLPTTPTVTILIFRPT